MLLPLKQGLKHGDPIPECLPTKVVMLLPLKQGLKPYFAMNSSSSASCCYATSIKTRIETGSMEANRFSGVRCCYATSIKTRIETSGILVFKLKFKVVMLLPLKQGLKLEATAPIN